MRMPNLVTYTYSERTAMQDAEPWAAVFLAALLLVVALTFSISPMNGEDYALTKQFFDVDMFDRLSWVVERSGRQVKTWNARLGEQLSIFWLSMPPIWFAVTNLVAVASFTFLLALFATPEISWNRQTIVVACFLSMAACLLFWPRLEIFFWRTTAAGYLQPLVMTLLLTLPFYSVPACRTLLRGWAGGVLFILLGLICGLSFENVPPALLPYMALMTWCSWRMRSEYWIKLGLVALSYLMGWCLLMAAPSTQSRTAYYYKAFNIQEPSVLYFYRKALDALEIFFMSSAPLILALVALTSITIYLHRGLLRQPIRFYLLCIPAGLCVASVIKAPYIEPRAFSLAWCILLIFLVRVVQIGMQAISARAAQAFIACLGVVSIGLAGQIFTEYLDFSRKISLRNEKIMEKSKSAECQSGLIFEIIPIRNDLSPRILNNREEWVRHSIPQMNSYFNCNLRLATHKE